MHSVCQEEIFFVENKLTRTYLKWGRGRGLNFQLFPLLGLPCILTGPQETRSLLQSQVHNYTIGPTNWDYKEVFEEIVYRRTDIGVSHKLDWSRPVELKTIFSKPFHTISLIYSKLNGDFSLINYMEYMYRISQNDRKCQNASKCLFRNGTKSNDTSSYILWDHSNAFGLSGGNFFVENKLTRAYLKWGSWGGGGEGGRVEFSTIPPFGAPLHFDRTKQVQVHNYTIGPTNWDYKEVSVINSLRGDAVTRIVYRRTVGRTDGWTDRQTSGYRISSTGLDQKC